LEEIKMRIDKIIRIAVVNILYIILSVLMILDIGVIDESIFEVAILFIAMNMLIIPMEFNYDKEAN
jgi:hypothetical protein